MTKVEKDALWSNVYDVYQKAVKEYSETDPSDPMYGKICSNLKEAQEKMVTLYNDEKNHRWDIIKFSVGTGVGLLQTIGTWAFGLTMMDFEATGSMTSKFWPVVQKALPFRWKPDSD